MADSTDTTSSKSDVKPAERRRGKKYVKGAKQSKDRLASLVTSTDITQQIRKGQKQIARNKIDRVGRKTVLNAKLCEQMVELMSQGASECEAAVMCGVSFDSFVSWCGKAHSGDELYMPFLSALKEGRWRSRAWWESAGRENLGNHRFNTPLWIRNMYNRFPADWKSEKYLTVKKQENVTLTIEGPNGNIDTVSWGGGGREVEDMALEAIEVEAQVVEDRD